MATINGSVNGEALDGTSGDDTINAGAGNDILDGKEGTDFVNGEEGDDTITIAGAAAGFDYVDGGADTDTLIVDWSHLTTAIGDYTQPGYGDGLHSSGGGVTIVYRNIERLTLTAGSGDDFLITGTSDDTIHLGAGNDFVDLVSGNDTADGGAGEDGFSGNLSYLTSGITLDLVAGTSTGSLFDNFEYAGTITTTAFADTIVTRDSLKNETFILGAGDDSITVRHGTDLILAGEGDDTLIVDWGHLTTSVFDYSQNGYSDGFHSSGGGATVAYDSVEKLTLTTGSGNDRIITGTSDDDVTLGDGDDFVDLVSGDDRADGGAGTDGLSADLSAATSGVTINFSTGSSTGNRFDNFEYAETITATAFADTIITGSILKNEILNMGGGDDVVTVRNGVDQILAGDGVDTLTVDWSHLTTSVQDYSQAGYSDGFHSSGGGATVIYDSIEKLNVYTGSANDQFTTGASDDTVNSGDGNDIVYAGDGNDVLDGSGGSDQIYGQGGDDIITVTGGTTVTDTPYDLADGGAGIDRLILDYSNLTQGIGVYRASDSASGGASGSAQFPGGSVKLGFSGIEHFTITGGSAGDTLNGGDRADQIDGGAGADTLYGHNGDDELDGGAGADMMYGGRGNDTYIVDDIQDGIVESTGAGIDLVETALTDYTLAARTENLQATGLGQNLTGNTFNNGIVGSVAADALMGVSGDDVLVGSLGGDYLDGGAGRDILIAGAVNPTNLVVNGSFETQDGVNNARAFIQAGAADYSGVHYRMTSTLFGWQTTDGSQFELNTDNGNTSYGTGHGDVSLDLETDLNKNIGIFQDIAGVPAGTALLLSFAAALGTGGPISATTNAILEVYWNGVLVATVTSTGTVMTQHAFVVVAAETGTGLNGANRLEFREVGGGSDARGTNLDAVRLNAIVPGLDDGENDLNGDSGNDTLIGDAGADSLSGGTGLDVLIGGAGNDGLSGNDDDDTLDGGAGDDTLDGGSGNDTLAGGVGNDIYSVDSSEDVVIEETDGGTDEIRTGLAAFSLAGLAHVENLTGTNIAAGQELTGNALANVITGTAFGDTIDGGAGDDTLRGGDGDDIYIVDDAGTKTIEDSAGTDRVQTSLAVFSIAGVASVENLTGTSDAGQTLTGNAGANSITGAAGADTLDGGAGADVLTGGDGADVYIVDSFDDQVAEAPDSTGADEVRTAIGSRSDYNNLYVLGANIEKLTGTSAGDQGVRANTLSNVVAMGAGNDLVVLDDGGEDQVSGGGGNDFFYFGSSWSDGDIADGGSGYDTLGLLGNTNIFFEASDLVGIEQISVYGGAGFGGGPYSYNLTFDNANVAAGERLLVNGRSLGVNDALIVDGWAETDGRFTVLGGAGADNVTGGAKGDHLDGGGNRDSLFGEGGNDTLIGGAGGDRLEGGEGRDTFVYGGASDSTGTGFDQLVGFDQRVDRIDLPGVVSGFGGTVRSGTLSEGTFDQDLATAVNGLLNAGNAVLFQANAGGFAGRAFLVVDANGDGSYTAGADYVFEIIAPAVPLDSVSFFL